MAMLLLILYAIGFVVPLHGNRPWQGPCGRPILSSAQSLSRSGTTDSVSAALIAYLVGQYTYKPEETSLLNPWLVGLWTKTGERFSQFAFAAFVRASPDQEKSDIAITSASVCELIKLNRRKRVTNWAVFRTYHKEKMGFYAVLIIDCYLHEGYRNTRPHKKNLAVIRMNEMVEFGSTGRPVCLPEEEERFPVGTPGTVPGLGHFGTLSGELRMIRLQIADRRNCSNMFHHGNDDSLCAVGRGGEASGHRPTDNGGPFVVERNGKWVAIGVALNPGLPTAVTDISLFVHPNDWLERTIKTVSAMWN